MHALVYEVSSRPPWAKGGNRGRERGGEVKGKGGGEEGARRGRGEED